ncbi:MAG: N-6 DNA methylase [Oscillospiraceae bacterium]|nr:N-6 DNA methylase [Oscillospiraceae bacterium]
MEKSKPSETVTENIFRSYYGTDIFIEKSAIPSRFGFTSKKGTAFAGYPDFFLDNGDYCIVAEAKADDHPAAQRETRHYMAHNHITEDVIGIAVSGQSAEEIKATYYLKEREKTEITLLCETETLMPLLHIRRRYLEAKHGERVTDEAMINVMKDLNRQFNNGNKIRDTDRSLFFSGLMIALKNQNFRSIYRNIQAPHPPKDAGVPPLEAQNLNEEVLKAITEELEGGGSPFSRAFSWRDRFSFLKQVDYPLPEYKGIISKIEKEIFYPFLNEEKQDILGRAYKIFLSRAGKVDNKNIILTPDHIKELMVRLARLSPDDVVLDTCTGSGGFLMEAMETMIAAAHGDEKKIRHIKEEQLIGFETDAVLYALACCNMFLHGNAQADLLYRSSLLDAGQADRELFEYIRKKHPTRVIINPPYENNNPIKFTLQALKYLDNNGKLVIIMPTPTLTHNQGNGLTQKVLSMAKLDYVIKMPNKLFSEQKRTVNASIFGFTKTPHQKEDEVLFYDLEDDGFISVQHKGRIDKNKTWEKIENGIMGAVFNAKEIPGVCRKKKIYKKDVLNCAGVPEKRDSNYEMVRIGDLFEIEEGALASENNIEGRYPFVTAGEKWKTHCAYSYDAEAIVYAVKAAGSLGRSHYISGKFTASNLCLVLTDKKDPQRPIDLQFYNCYFAALRRQLVADLADGTSKLTISAELFKDYYIDYVPYEEQREFVEKELNKFLKLQKRYLTEQKRLEETIARLV